MTINNRLKLQTADRKLLAGFEKHWPTTHPLTLAAKVFQPADVAATLQRRVDACARIEVSNAAWRNDVKTEADLRAETHAEMTALRQIILAMFGTSIATLADFGLAPRKARTVSPETSVEAAAKSRATRAARHTMGKVAREKIKGAPPTAASTPPTASTPSPSPGTL